MLAADHLQKYMHLYATLLINLISNKNISEQNQRAKKIFELQALLFNSCFEVLFGNH